LIFSHVAVRCANSHNTSDIKIYDGVNVINAPHVFIKFNGSVTQRSTHVFFVVRLLISLGLDPRVYEDFIPYETFA